MPLYSIHNQGQLVNCSPEEMFFGTGRMMFLQGHQDITLRDLEGSIEVAKLLTPKCETYWLIYKYENVLRTNKSVCI